MGYYANGNGDIVAKDIDAYRKIRAMFGYNPGTNNTPYDFWEDENNLTFCIDTNDKYHEDDVIDFLHEISGLISKGVVEYVGEDDCFWRFVFDPDTVNWKEEDGYVTYGKPSLSDVSDGDLIIELEKRGYVVRDL